MENITRALAAGNYTVTIESKGNDNVTGFVTSADFTVNKTVSSVVINSIGNATYPDPVVINFTASYASDVNWTIVNKETGDKITGSGLENITQALAAGNYTVTIESKGNDNTTGFVTSADFTVAKANSTVTIAPIVNVTYNATVTVSYVVVNDTVVSYEVVDATGAVVVQNTTVSDLSVPIALAGLNAGNYTIVIANAENENYTASSAKANFTVFKANSTVNASDITSVYGTNPKFVFSTENATSVNITVLDENNTSVFDRYFVTSNQVNLPVLFVGNYTIRLWTNPLNDNYAVGFNEYNWTITKKNSNVIIWNVANVTYDATVSVEFSVSGKTNVTYIVKTQAGGTIVINTTEIARIDEIRTILTLKVLKPGNYTITITNAENENYVASSASANFTVFKAGSLVDITRVDNVTYNSNVSVVFGVINSTNVTYTLTYANGTVIVKDKHAGTSLILENLWAGNYTITVTNAENENYTGSSDSANFTVFKAGSLVNINPIVNVTYPSAITVNYGVENRTNVTYTLSYANGTVVAENVEISDSTITLANLRAGNYTITIANAEAENYTGDVKSANFTVFKAPSNVTVVVDNVTYDAVVGVDVTVVNATVVTYTLKYANGTVIVENVPVSDLTKNLTLTLGAGNYTISVFNAEGDNYTASEASANFTVFKAGSLVTIYQVNNVTYNAIVSVVFGVRNSTNVTYTLSYANGTVIVKDVRTGESLILTNLGAGNYTITIVNAENENYTGDVKSANFTVFKAASLVTIDPIDNVTYNATVTVNYAVVNDTVVTYVVSDDEGNVVVSNTTVDQLTGSIALSGLKAGNYTITIANAENENYTGDVKSANFTVFKANSTLNVSDITFDYGKEGNTTVTYTGASDVTAVIDGQDPTAVKVENGIITVSGLAAGTYTMNVTTVPDENHTAVSKLVNVTVNKVPSTLEVSNVTFTYGEEGNTTVSFTGAVNVTAVVTGHSEAVIKIEGGLIKVSGLAVGNYTMNVTTVPDANHTAVSKLVNVTVSKISDYTMDVNSTVVQQGDNTTVIVNVPENATGNVTVTLSNGTNYTAEVKNGTAAVNVGQLPAGDNDLTVSYSGDDIYAGKTSNVTAHVKELVILAGDLVRGWDSPYDYLAKLLDEDGNPAAGRTLVFVVGGNEYNATTDSNGLAKLTTSKLDVGKYNVTTKYPENGANETHKIEIVARIIENKDLVMDYKDGHKFRVRAIGDDGNPVGAGVVVKIKINGVTYKPKTDKKGYAELPINLIPRKYVATATYHNYAVKNKVKVRQILKLVKKTVKVKKGKKIVLKAKLKKTNGKALKGKKITFKFKGKKYKKGIAKVTIKKKKVLKKLKKGKKYKYSAKYIKDVVKGKVKIKK